MDGGAGHSAFPAADVSAFVGAEEGGVHRLNLLVDGVHCGGCVNKIERSLTAEADVTQARVNLSTGRLTLAWDGPAERGKALAAKVAGLGYAVTPYDPEALGRAQDRTEKQLLRALAVAGFAAGNVMLLSISIWAGHVEGMGEATRTLFHWFSALIALPAIVYAGRPFFASALSALRSGTTNMDVPISLALVLASGMSLFETFRGGEHAYFDSAVTLLFFLLIGRYLDHRARGKARSAAQRLVALSAQPVTVIDGGAQRVIRQEDVAKGMTVLVAAGQRVPVDGTILDGVSDIDTSLITGESLPQQVKPGDAVYAGTMNQGAALTLTVTAIAERTLLAEIIRLMETAEQKRAKYVALADRVARVYAPVVHGLALATFLGWTLVMGAAWQTALLYAVAVLIITCPCALGLAVPAVQVIASGRLMKAGILLKSGTALERLATVDTVLFDKTGTLTVGRPALQDPDAVDPEDLRAAASLAAASHHPLARALADAVPGAAAAPGVVEVPGHGLRRETEAGEVRLGNRDWCGVDDGPSQDGPEIWLAQPGRAPVVFRFADPLRTDAAEVVAALKRRGLRVEMLSGDRREGAEAVAASLTLDEWRARQLPADKTARLEELAQEGRHVLMVGDGINDAPALAAAHVSMSPSGAADISRTAADILFQGEKLSPVGAVLGVARRAQALVSQNFVLAIAYNLIAIPLAVLGFVTPLVAALCMSASSILVVSNSLRLARK